MVANLPEIVPAQAKQCCAVKFRVSAHVIVCMRVQLLAIYVTPQLFRVVLRIDVDGFRIPVVLFASHVVATLKNEDPLARGCQMVCKRSTAGSRSDDDYVKLILVAHDRLLQTIQAVTDSACSRRRWSSEVRCRNSR